jgi:hypothetical protein
MKKFLLLAFAGAMIAALTGCGSMRTPDGANNKKVYYHTFFGITIEGLVYGDGLIIHPIGGNK